MAIERKVDLYEVLVRFDADGRVKAAHQISMERIVDGATVVSEREQMAVPVDPADVGELLGVNMAAMLAQIDDLTRESAGKDEAVAAAQAQATALTARVAELEALLATPTDTIHIAWLKLALEEIGKLDEVDAAVARAGRAYAILWDYATTIRRTDPEVVAIGQALALDLDAIFARAEAIKRERGQ